jgi:hypothetical protein
MPRDSITLGDVREPHVLNKLRLMHGPGESYTDVILRLAAVGHVSLNGSRRASLDSLSISPSATVLCFRRRG